MKDQRFLSCKSAMTAETLFMTLLYIFYQICQPFFLHYYYFVINFQYLIALFMQNTQIKQRQLSAASKYHVILAI